MALVKCPDCGREVSDQAPTCPQCGRPLKAQAAAPQQAPATSSMEKWWKFTAILSVFSMVISLFSSFFYWFGRLFKRD
jgi:predicted amidophosphoribosyltransferase